MVAKEFLPRPGRVDFEVPVRLTTSRGAETVTSRNIGRGGLLLVTERKYSVGDRLALEFALTNPGEPLVVDAEVRWVRDDHGQRTRMGIRFFGIPIDAAVAIQELIRRRDEDLTPSGSAT